MSDALEHRTPQMNSPGGRREAQAAIIWNRGSCAPTERSVKGFSRLRRRAKRALDRPFGRRVPVTVPNNGGPWPWRLFPESLCDSNCESDTLSGDRHSSSKANRARACDVEPPSRPSYVAATLANPEDREFIRVLIGGDQKPAIRGDTEMPRVSTHDV